MNAKEIANRINNNIEEHSNNLRNEKALNKTNKHVGNKAPIIGVNLNSTYLSDEIICILNMFYDSGAEIVVHCGNKVIYCTDILHNDGLRFSRCVSYDIDDYIYDYVLNNNKYIVPILLLVNILCGIYGMELDVAISTYVMVLEYDNFGLNMISNLLSDINNK